MRMHMSRLLAPVIFFFAASGVCAQGVEWAGSVGISYHGHDFEDPLPWWDASAQAFPSAMLHSEAPMAFVGGPLGRVLFFETGLRYTRLASKVDWQFDVSSSGQTFVGAFRIRQHYLAVPAWLRVQLGRLPVYLTGGPEFGFLILARKKSETFLPEAFRSSQTESVGDDLRRVNVALYGGVGVTLAKGARIYGRYGAGLNHVKKDPERTVLDSDWTTREVEIGFQWPLFGRKDP